MKIYESLNVSVFFASFGNNWTIFLSGLENEIESTFLGLYNLGACRPNSKARGALEWNDNRTIAEFNSSEALMSNFFFNLSQMRGETKEQSNAFAEVKMSELKETQVCSERFNKTNSFTSYSTGKIGAESPDYDHRDSVIIDAFRPREKEQSEELETV